MSQIRADNITNRQGTGAPIFVNGIRVVGLTSISNIVANTGTFNGAVSIGGTLTYEDVTNVDAVGLITARSGIDVAAGGINAVGVVTASTGIDAASNLIVKTGGTERLRIDSSGNILGAGGQLRLKAAVGDSNGLKLYQGGSDTSYILNHYSGPLVLGTVNTERLRITTSGVKVTGGYTENIVAVSGTAVDCSTASYFTKTITGATTFTFTNVPTGVAYAFTFEVTLNGSNAITWPGTVKWPADTAPTITDGKTQVFVFLTDDGGTRWRGSSLVDYTN